MSRWVCWTTSRHLIPYHMFDFLVNFYLFIVCFIHIYLCTYCSLGRLHAYKDQGFSLGMADFKRAMLIDLNFPDREHTVSTITDVFHMNKTCPKYNILSFLFFNSAHTQTCVKSPPIIYKPATYKNQVLTLILYRKRFIAVTSMYNLKIHSLIFPRIFALWIQQKIMTLNYIFFFTEVRKW